MMSTDIPILIQFSIERPKNDLPASPVWVVKDSICRSIRSGVQVGTGVRSETAVAASCTEETLSPLSSDADSSSLGSTVPTATLGVGVAAGSGVAVAQAPRKMEIVSMAKNIASLG